MFYSLFWKRGKDTLIATGTEKRHRPREPQIVKSLSQSLAMERRFSEKAGACGSEKWEITFAILALPHIGLKL